MKIFYIRFALLAGASIFLHSENTSAQSGGTTPPPTVKILETSPSPVAFSEATLTQALKDLPLQMVLVEGDTFTMGCTAEQVKNCGDKEKPAHKVRLKSFYISNHEATQAEWQAVMGNNPSHFSGCADCPVENVSWDTIQVFISKLNNVTGKKYRLPTEAEWEFAARGGKMRKGYKYSGSNKIDTVAWYKPTSDLQTHPAGKKRANELGIYNMSGNVSEWCADLYDDNYYKNSPVDNPAGVDSSQFRAMRGSCWDDDAVNSRVSVRFRGTPGLLDSRIGFRLAQDY